MSYLQKYLPQETKDINVKTFNMITNKNEAKAMAKHTSCDYKCKLNSTTCNSNKKWNNKTFQYEWKSNCKCKKYYSWNPSTCICGTGIITVLDILSIKMTNTIATNVTSTASINCHCEKVRDCYILHTYYHW